MLGKRNISVSQDDVEFIPGISKVVIYSKLGDQQYAFFGDGETTRESCILAAKLAEVFVEDLDTAISAPTNHETSIEN